MKEKGIENENGREKRGYYMYGSWLNLMSRHLHKYPPRKGINDLTKERRHETRYERHLDYSLGATLSIPAHSCTVGLFA